jgi:hypothetical protein
MKFRAFPYLSNISDRKTEFATAFWIAFPDPVPGTPEAPIPLPVFEPAAVPPEVPELHRLRQYGGPRPLARQF